ncbi:zinc-binding alcohol dehydrogenase family protein [Gordonia sp. (in: high G+C Gram-positive bacteria)]|uniref:quinone oxidoreductase family protein n=1 Tax=Gordonia sp. (in: high G+C Gram-positive bacteria) TaxID=84139 RepID=UPI003528768A
MSTANAWTAHGFSGLDSFVFGPREVPAPGPGEITVSVTAAGVNPADLKHVRRASDPALLPMPIGYEIAGTVSATGPGAVLGSGAPAAIGDRVAAFRVHGGYAEALTVPATDAFALDAHVDHRAAAGLLLAGCTAAELLHRSGARRGDTVVVHGASGAVGTVVLQLARRAGITVIGTCGPDREDDVRRFGGIPVPRTPSPVPRPLSPVPRPLSPVEGTSLAARIRAAAPGPIVAALDCAGTPEAVAASLDLVPERSRILTVAAPAAAREYGFTALAGTAPDSAAYRDSVRAQLVSLLGTGELTVPIARTFGLSEARAALELVASGHAHGKVVLLP